MVYLYFRVYLYVMVYLFLYSNSQQCLLYESFCPSKTDSTFHIEEYHCFLRYTYSDITNRKPGGKGHDISLHIQFQPETENRWSLHLQHKLMVWILEPL